jgi:hypothetical protein
MAAATVAASAAGEPDAIGERGRRRAVEAAAAPASGYGVLKYPGGRTAVCPVGTSRGAARSADAPDANLGTAIAAVAATRTATTAAASGIAAGAGAAINPGKAGSAGAGAGAGLRTTRSAVCPCRRGHPDQKRRKTGCSQQGRETARQVRWL